jgi:hypothetical protein
MLNASNNNYVDWWFIFPDFTVKINKSRVEGLHLNWSDILNAPSYTAYNDSWIYNSLYAKLNVTDQRYNDTALIVSVNNSKAMVGSCGEGFAVQNSTIYGVECVNISSGGITSVPYQSSASGWINTSTITSTGLVIEYNNPSPTNPFRVVDTGTTNINSTSYMHNASSVYEHQIRSTSVGHNRFVGYGSTVSNYGVFEWLAIKPTSVALNWDYYKFIVARVNSTQRDVLLDPSETQGIFGIYDNTGNQFFRILEAGDVYLGRSDRTQPINVYGNLTANEVCDVASGNCLSDMGSLIATTPLSYDSGTNTISIPKAEFDVSGYLNGSDYNYIFTNLLENISIYQNGLSVGKAKELDFYGNVSVAIVGSTAQITVSGGSSGGTGGTGGWTNTSTTTSTNYLVSANNSGSFTTYGIGSYALSLESKNSAVSSGLLITQNTTGSSYALLVKSGGRNWLVARNDLKVGIGTDSPSSTLHVNGSSNFTGDLVVNGGTFDVDTILNRVGIGTNNPSRTLDVRGDVYSTQNYTLNGSKSFFTIINTDTGNNVAWGMSDNAGASPRAVMRIGNGTGGAGGSVGMFYTPSINNVTMIISAVSYKDFTNTSMDNKRLSFQQNSTMAVIYSSASTGTLNGTALAIQTTPLAGGFKGIFIQEKNNYVGINNTNPVSMLDVNGMMRVNGTYGTCTSAIEGSIVYNSTAFKHYGCNSTNWNALY